jgi:DNA-binding NarL/FixJ family response regulator
MTDPGDALAHVHVTADRNRAAAAEGDERPTLVVCDSSEISRVGITRSLEAYDLPVAADAHDRGSALAVVRSRQPAVVLVDMSLLPAPTAALDVIAAVVAAGGTPIAIGVDSAPDHVFAALRAGASGYLTKDLPAAAWAGAIRAAARGETPLSRAVTALLVDRFRSQAALSLHELLPSDRRLTRREWDVLEQVASGKTNRAVAAELSISFETVRTHVSNILTKLDAPSRSAAAARYHELRAVHG